MYATLHPLRGAPGPHHVTWVGPLVAALSDPVPPASVSVSCQLAAATGLVACRWTDAADAARAADREYRQASPVVVDRGRVLDIVHSGTGTGTDPGFAQVIMFDGPRSQVLADAELRASRDRIEPAVRDLPGFCGAMSLRSPDLGGTVLVFAESVEALEECSRRIMSTELLPGEDPALLIGPDRIEVHRVLHASADLLATSTAAGAR